MHLLIYSASIAIGTATAWVLAPKMKKLIEPEKTYIGTTLKFTLVNYVTYFGIVWAIIKLVSYFGFKNPDIPILLPVLTGLSVTTASTILCCVFHTKKTPP